MDAPDPNATRCVDCGHVWFTGERRHVHVDVHGEAADADHADAEAVCLLCQRARQRSDAEHGTAGGTSAPERWSWG